MKEHLKKILPKSNLVQEFNGNFIYQVPLENLVVSELFQQIEQVKESFQISGMSDTRSRLGNQPGDVRGCVHENRGGRHLRNGCKGCEE